MRVFRVLGVVTVLAIAVAAVPAGAATVPMKPQVRDAGGDWKVASQDVLDATFTATTKQLRADLHLSAPPATGIPGKYDLAMYVGCAVYSLHFTWNGGLPGSTATLDRYACLTGDQVTDTINGQQPVSSTPATATLTSTGLRIVAAPTAALHRGTKVAAFVETRLEPAIVGSSGFDPNDPSYGGDIAFGSKNFLLGY